jgi:Phosphatidylglycerophosphate synthase
MKKEQLPNLLTASRIVLSFCLLFLPVQSVWFILLYLICGLTDILDGYLARRMKADSQLGARLDSLADLCMCLMIILTIIRQTSADQPILIGLCIIFVVRAGNVVFSKFKFGRASSVHTMANKLTGLLLFFCPLAVSFIGNGPLWLTGFAALLACAEEFLILLLSDDLDLNRKSIFTKSSG